MDAGPLFKAIRYVRRWEPDRFRNNFYEDRDPDDPYHYLAQLFGFNSWHGLVIDYAHGHELESKIRMLVGEHGYCYYRALLARRADVC